MLQLRRRISVCFFLYSVFSAYSPRYKDVDVSLIHISKYSVLSQLIYIRLISIVPLVSYLPHVSPRDKQVLENSLT